MVSIVHASRSRAAKAFKTARKFLDNAGCDCEYILSIDFDDPHKKDYYNDFFFSKLISCQSNRSAVDAINNGAKMATGNILIVISDDFDCTPLWGQKIIDATKDLSDWCMKTPDGIQHRLITLPIMDRKYYERFNYIYHPDYLHMFADKEMTFVAELTGRKIEVNIPFMHDHYSTGRCERDIINVRADATVAQGQKLFNERRAHKFYL